MLAGTETLRPAAVVMAAVPGRDRLDLFRPTAEKIGIHSELMTGRDSIVEAQHLLSADHAQGTLLKNPFDVELVRDGTRWMIRRIVIDNVRFTGHPRVIFGPGDPGR